MSAGQKFKCEICGKKFKAITSAHLKKHEITTEQYRQRFPDSIMGDFSRFDDWRRSEANMQNLKNMTDIVYSSEELKRERAEAVRLATQTPEYRQKQSFIMKQLVEKNPEKFRRSRKVFVTDWMKKSNYERWLIQYGKEEADRRQNEWNRKNILPSHSFDTKPEIQFSKFLDELHIEYEKQKCVGKYKYDFFLKEYNTIIEIDGGLLACKS